MKPKIHFENNWHVQSGRFKFRVFWGRPQKYDELPKPFLTLLGYFKLSQILVAFPEYMNFNVPHQEVGLEKKILQNSHKHM